jgi:hypothetical protein
VVEHSTHNPNIEYSNPATDNRREKVSPKNYSCKSSEEFNPKSIIELLFQKDIEA